MAPERLLIRAAKAAAAADRGVVDVLRVLSRFSVPLALPLRSVCTRSASCGEDCTAPVVSETEACC